MIRHQIPDKFMRFKKKAIDENETVELPAPLIFLYPLSKAERILKHAMATIRVSEYCPARRFIIVSKLYPTSHRCRHRIVVECNLYLLVQFFLQTFVDFLREK